MEKKESLSSKTPIKGQKFDSYKPPEEAELRAKGALPVFIGFGNELKRLSDLLSSKDKRLDDSLSKAREDMEILYENYTSNITSLTNELNDILDNYRNLDNKLGILVEKEGTGLQKVSSDLFTLTSAVEKYGHAANIHTDLMNKLNITLNQTVSDIKGVGDRDHGERSRMVTPAFVSPGTLGIASQNNIDRKFDNIIKKIEDTRVNDEVTTMKQNIKKIGEEVLYKKNFDEWGKKIVEMMTNLQKDRTSEELIIDLQTKLKDMENKVKDLENSKSITKNNQIDELRSLLKKEEENVKLLTTEISKKESLWLSEKNELIKEIATLKKNIVENKLRDDEIKKREDKINKANNDLKEREEKLEEEISTNNNFKDREQNINEELKKKEKNLNNVDEELKKREKSLNNISKELEKREKEITDTSKELEKREKEISNTSKELEKREKEISDTDIGLKKREDKLNSTNELLKRRKEEINNKEEEIVEIKKDLKKKEGDIANIKEQNISLQNELEKIRNDRDNKINEFKERIRKLEEKPNKKSQKIVNIDDSASEAEINKNSKKDDSEEENEKPKIDDSEEETKKQKPKNPKRDDSEDDNEETMKPMLKKNHPRKIKKNRYDD